MEDDEDMYKYNLRSLWYEFTMGEEIVSEIVKTGGKYPHDENKIIKLASTDDDDIKHRIDAIKSYFGVLSETTAIKAAITAAIKAIDSVIELIPIFKAIASDNKMDTILKQTYDLINDADNEMKKVDVGKEFLMKNLKSTQLIIFGGVIMKTIIISDLSEDKKKECIKAVDIILNTKSEISENDKNLVINTINEFLNPSSPQPGQPSAPSFPPVAPVAPVTPTSSKLQPAGPQYITIKGNKYSVVPSAINDSHKMVYNDATKCWKENKSSGGATKSKKKRGPKSRAKSSTKSRPKSRRY